MKASLLTVLVLATGGLVPSIFAQTADTSAAPVTQVIPAVPSKIVYAVRLPTPQELTSTAAAQGLTIATIEQTGSEIAVTYKSGNGQTNTVSYQLLPAPGAAPTPGVVASAPPAATPVPSTPPPTIVYTQPAATQVIYTQAPAPVYYDPYYSYPWGWYPSYPRVVVGIGFHGGYHHGWR